jgi:hypothetical protein
LVIRQPLRRKFAADQEGIAGKYALGRPEVNIGELAGNGHRESGSMNIAESARISEGRRYMSGRMPMVVVRVEEEDG